MALNSTHGRKLKKEHSIWMLYRRKFGDKKEKSCWILRFFKILLTTLSAPTTEENGNSFRIQFTLV